MNAKSETIGAGRLWMLSPAALIACIAVSSATPDAALKEGDAHDAKLQAKEALSHYLEAEKAQPENADVLVRIARQYRHLMADTSSVSEKLRLGNLALGYGKRASAIAPNNSDAVLSPAITYGKMVKYLPKKEQIAASKVIKANAEKAVKLDPKNDLAWHVLGRWHRVASDVGTVKRALAGMLYEKLPPASAEEAAKCLGTAANINPQRVIHQIELGKAYAQLGRKEDARRHLQKGLSMPSREKDDPAMKQSGRETLATL